MLRYTVSELDRVIHPLDWNAKFEFAVVHIRDLYGFLSSSDGNQNIGARDYVAGFQPDDARGLDGIRNKANPQMFHMGKQRLYAAKLNTKLNTESAKKALGWVETSMKKFVTSLPAPYDDAWVPENSDPGAVELLRLSATGPSQSSHPTATQTDTMTLQSITGPGFTGPGFVARTPDPGAGRAGSVRGRRDGVNQGLRTSTARPLTPGPLGVHA